MDCACCLVAAALEDTVENLSRKTWFKVLFHGQVSQHSLRKLYMKWNDQSWELLPPIPEQVWNRAFTILLSKVCTVIPPCHIQMSATSIILWVLQNSWRPLSFTGLATPQKCKLPAKKMAIFSIDTYVLKNVVSFSRDALGNIISVWTKRDK